MKIKVEGSHDIRTIERVKSITIMPEDAKATIVLFMDEHKSIVTIKEEENG